MLRFGLSIDANTSSESRTGTLVIRQTESNRTVNVTITQAGAATYVFSVSQSTLSVGAPASSQSVTVTSTKNGSSQGFSVNSASDWITATIGNNGQVTLAIDANTGSTSRSGYVSFIQNESGNTCNVDVIQAAADTYVLSVNPTTIDVDSSSHSTTIEVTSTKNGSEISANVESNPNWVSVTIV